MISAEISKFFQEDRLLVFEDVSQKKKLLACKEISFFFLICVAKRTLWIKFMGRHPFSKKFDASRIALLLSQIEGLTLLKKVLTCGGCCR